MNVATICDHLPLTDRFGLGQRCRSVLETLMANTLAESIEKWFSDREGEFVDYGSKFPSYKNSSFATAEVLVYTTKYHALTRVANKLFGTDVGILARPGLPRLDDLQAIEATYTRLVFLGDADPADLLTFAWLRAYTSIEFLGVNDQFLRNYFTGPWDRIHIALSECELASLTFLAQIMPEYPALVGPYCSMLLANGFKIELEGATMSIET